MISVSEFHSHRDFVDVSIVIVGWNTCELLINCIKSILASQTEYKFEVWVVDNASSDQSVEMVRTHFPDVNIIENRENLGFARANNQAIRRCKGQYILLLNPDTELVPCAINTMAGFLDEELRAGAAGARLLNLDGTLQASCYPEPTLSRELWRLLHLDFFWSYGEYDMNRWKLNETREVDVLKGACILFRREALEQVGLLPEEYFMYSEEVDLCYSLRKKGWKLFWVPQAEVVHYEAQSTQQVAAEMFLHLYRGKLLFFRKHRGNFVARLYKFVLAFAAIARMALIPLIWIENPDRREHHLMLTKRYHQLLLTLPSM